MAKFSEFKASLRLLSVEQGGREQPVALVIGYIATHWFRPQLAFLGENVMRYDCSVEHPSPETVDWFELRPSGEAEVLIKMFVALPIEIGSVFQLYEGGKLVGSGVATQIFKD